MRTKDETATDRHARTISALADLERSALNFASKPPSDWTRGEARNEMARLALIYAARVRRLAGVR